MVTSEEQAQGGEESAPRPRRWGIWTLGFLTLAMFAMIVSQNAGEYTFGTLGSIMFGLVGATYSTVQGIRQIQREGVWRLLTTRREQRRRS